MSGLNMEIIKEANLVWKSPEIIWFFITKKCAA
jgi:hypothetical protein